MSKHSIKASSLETSPDILYSETSPFDSKFASKNKAKNSRNDNTTDDDKLKSNSKKSIFSLLNFGKSNMSKEKVKQKSKDSEKEMSSTPNDFCERPSTKTKTFSHLKLAKSKDKSSKPKTKPLQADVSNSPLLENTVPPNEAANSFASHEANIIPKYTVYRTPESMISTFPVHLPVPKIENGLAPKASEDSFSDEEDTQGSKAGPNVDKCDKVQNEKERKAQRIVQKVQRQQVLRRLRNAQEIKRRLEELEVEQKELEYQGVELEKLLRGEDNEANENKNEAELEWYTLVHAKNKLMREEQELLIRLKDLELEDRQSRLRQELGERMAQNESKKDATQIMEGRKILDEMLEIVEKRDELVAMLEQLRLKEVEEERNISTEVFNKGLKSPELCGGKS